MAVAWRKHHRPSLETQLWRRLEVEGRELLVKGLFQEDGYEVMVCDLCSVWEENLDQREIGRRAKVRVRLCVCGCGCGCGCVCVCGG